MEWYVISVKTGREEDVQNRLNARFNESFFSLVPKKHLIEKRQGETNHVIEKLFPGYVFIRTNMDRNKFKVINRMTGVVRLVSADTDYSRIDDNEMDIILKLINKDGIIECSKLLKENSKITVLEGPLLGMESIIKKVNSHTNRARILLNLMGDPRTFEVGVEIIYKLKNN